MRTALALLAVIISTAVSAGELQSHGFALPFPDDLSIFRRSDSESVQYRGTDGELWTIVVIRPVVKGPDDTALLIQKQIEKMLDEKEKGYRVMAERYSKARVIHRSERRSLPGDAVLLVFAFQGNRDGKTHTTLDFNTYWGDGSQVLGTVEWWGPLEQKYDGYTSMLGSIRLVSEPNSTVERDARKSGARSSP
jgi:hypothetical protein